MSNYFTFFPTIEHDLKDTNQKTELTNILRRFRVKPKTKSIASVYYDYTVQEGDRPDTIAEKYYGSSKLSWIVLHYNDIIDPYYHWPLFGKEFTQYIIDKYGSVTSATSTVKHYYKILAEENVLFNGVKQAREEIRIDLKTYNSLASTPLLRRAETQYDYEEAENEKKRRIKILDKRYANQLIKELASVLN